MRSRVADAGLGARVVVDSAGIGAWHVGHPADQRALATLRAHGYDGSAHLARQFDRTWFAARDLVVAMDAANLRALRRLATPEDAGKLALLRSFDPAAPADDLEVPDPYDGRPGGFEHVLTLVEAACAGLVDDLVRMGR